MKAYGNNHHPLPASSGEQEREFMREMGPTSWVDLSPDAFTKRQRLVQSIAHAAAQEERQRKTFPWQHRKLILTVIGGLIAAVIAGLGYLGFQLDSQSKPPAPAPAPQCAPVHVDKHVPCRAYLARSDYSVGTVHAGPI
jgi:hypothetical protein